MKGKGKDPNLDCASAIEEELLDRKFDCSNFVDVREQSLSHNLTCNILTPLMSSPGCLVVTNDRLYFQAADGVILSNDTNVINWLIDDVVATARRYDELYDRAMEIFLNDNTSVLLAFGNSNDRELVLNLLHQVPCHTDQSFLKDAVEQWSQDSLSNFEYLLILNSAAGRTFHDLSRYPVFPWVIADYTSSKLDLKVASTFRDLSKPMGALNPDRLKYFTMRMASMEEMDSPFLYGTHYSAPGYVLYYLVRCMPEHMLCLQNVRFLLLFICLFSLTLLCCDRENLMLLIGSSILSSKRTLRRF